MTLRAATTTGVKGPKAACFPMRKPVNATLDERDKPPGAAKFCWLVCWATEQDLPANGANEPNPPVEKADETARQASKSTATITEEAALRPITRILTLWYAKG